MPIWPGDMRDKSPKLSKIAPILCSQIFRVQSPQKLYQNFHACLTAHLVDKFSEVIAIATDPKLIHPKILNCAHIFELLPPPHTGPTFLGAPKFLDLTFKAQPISHHMAKSDGDWSRELRNFGLKSEKKTCCQHCYGGGPNFGMYICLSAHIFNHVSKFHGNRQPEDIALQSARKKLQ